MIDKKYRGTFHLDHCWMCGSTPCQGAHIRQGHEAGWGQKPTDELIIPLCHKCHLIQEVDRGNEFALLIVKNMARNRYFLFENGVLEEWKMMTAAKAMS